MRIVKAENLSVSKRFPPQSLWNSSPKHISNIISEDSRKAKRRNPAFELLEAYSFRLWA